MVITITVLERSDNVSIQYNDLSRHKLTCIRGSAVALGYSLGLQNERSGFNTYPRRVVSLSKDAFTPRKVLVIFRKRRQRADMKEIVDWDVKHSNTKKQAFWAFKAV